jgi:hypothetical protein
MLKKKSKPPFQFDLISLIERVRRIPRSVDGVAINLPFVSVSVKPDDLERQTAREVVIRLADRRVLNAFECCDNCIRNALISLQEIRRFLVEKQVELSDFSDGPVYLLLEAMLEAIRQFFTFEQRLDVDSHSGQRDKYFSALEMLRAHLYRVLQQVAVLASIEIPKISDRMRYDEVWQTEAYVRTPPLSTSQSHAPLKEA